MTPTCCTCHRVFLADILDYCLRRNSVAVIGCDQCNPLKKPRP